MCVLRGPGLIPQQNPRGPCLPLTLRGLLLEACTPALRRLRELARALGQHFERAYRLLHEVLVQLHELEPCGRVVDGAGQRLVVGEGTPSITPRLRDLAADA